MFKCQHADNACWHAPVIAHPKEAVKQKSLDCAQWAMMLWHASAYDMPAKALRLAMLTPNKTLTWAQVQAHRCHGIGLTQCRSKAGVARGLQ